MSIEKGDKVTTPNGLGIVIDDKVYDPIFLLSPPRCRVKLNGSGEERDFGLNVIEISSKKPSVKEAIEAADKIKKQINEIPIVSTRDRGELGNHLEYIKTDIQGNKDLMFANLQYVDETLKVYKKVDSTAPCWKVIESELEKLRWRAKFC